ncbi:hypothetical protein [Dinoroseobacter sp. S124A]|uniref:hypothetical protein n=1 Tax=Dinoroseobacter sp. S124A TaxID=3415128 RepID=UPI003C7BBAED
MHIAYHIGAHSTDDDLLLTSLRANAPMLERNGVIVPPGDVYRPILRETVRRLQGAHSDRDAEEAVLEAIVDGKDGHRLIMASENFICTQQKIFDEGSFYGKMGQKAVWLRNVFPHHPVSFHIGLRSPSSFLPAIFARRQNISFEDFLAEIDLETVSWHDVIERLRFAVPDAEITVWCNEDTPLIWPEVMTSITNLTDNSALHKRHARLREVMTQDGFEQFIAYLDSHPKITVAQRRWAAVNFLDRFAKAEEMDESYDLPDWSQGRIDDLDAAYEKDLERIATLPDVQVLAVGGTICAPQPSEDSMSVGFA